MPRSLFALLCLLTVAGAGCSKKPQMDLPSYPGAMGAAGGGTFQTETSTLWHNVTRTADSLGSVRAFYTAEFEGKRGWKVHAGGGVAWNNGNMTWAGGTATADDPLLEAGFVQLIETDRETIIDLWQSKPKPTKK